MALNSIAQTPDAEASATEASAPAMQAPRGAAPEFASPITAEDAKAIAGALRAGRGSPNPVAEVQAKLRAAMEAKPTTSQLQDAAFCGFVLASCLLMAALGVLLGIVCVLFGAAMFLFPVSAGTALGAFVLAVGGMFYFLYTRGAAPQNADENAKPSETFECLAAGRYRATGVA